VTLERDADGDVKAVQRTAMLVPVTLDTLSSIDTIHIEFTHADGAMINAVEVASVNDQIDSDLHLDPEKGHWHVTGEFKTKKLDKTIESSNPPRTWLWQALQRRALLSTDAAAPREAIFALWISPDPTHFTESRITFLDRTGKSGEARFRESEAGIDQDVTVDAVTAQLVRATFPIGSETITLERLDAQGTY
jgi:hypothetical protein